MREYHIDLKNIFSADDFHELLEQTLPLPDYYGRNLDALYDVLTEQSEGWDITFSGCADAEAILGKYMKSIRRMCEKAQGENEKLKVTFD